MNRPLRLKTLDGFEISAVHTTIAKRTNHIVLWLHGITVNKDEYLNLFRDGAEYLADHGVDSLRIDFRGHGSSSGSSLDFSIVGQMFDVESALTYLWKRYSRHQINIHIVGCSFGAPPAIFAAACYPDDVKNLVLIAPVLSYDLTFLAPKTNWAKSIFSKTKLKRMAKTQKLYFNAKFPVSIQLVEEMKIIRPDLALGQLKQKTVLIHGEADSMVPFSVSKELALQTSKVHLIAMNNMDHGFNDADDEQGNDPRSIENKQRIFKIIQRCVNEA